MSIGIVNTYIYCRNRILNIMFNRLKVIDRSKHEVVTLYIGRLLIINIKFNYEQFNFETFFFFNYQLNTRNEYYARSICKLLYHKYYVYRIPWSYF